MDKRELSKKVVRLLVMLNVSSYVSKELAQRAPATQTAHANEVAGYVAGAAASAKAGPYTDDLVDTFWDRRAAKKNPQS